MRQKIKATTIQLTRAEGFVAKTYGDDGETIYRQDRSTFLVPLDN